MTESETDQNRIELLRGTLDMLILQTLQRAIRAGMQPEAQR